MPRVKQPRVKQPRVKQPAVKQPAVKQPAAAGGYVGASDQDKPTCKVVKRAGQRGARIAPRGCKVRTDIDADGRKTRRNKAGETKIKLVELDRKFILAVAGPKQQSVINGWEQRSPQSKRNYKEDNHMLYDTGAMVTLMSRALLQRLGINWKRTTNTYTTNISGVGGDQQTKVLVGVEFYIQIDWFTNQWTKVKADIHVMPTDDNTSRLLGVDVIRQLTRLTVKFRE